jgi:hypothetical protein
VVIDLETGNMFGKVVQTIVFVNRTFAVNRELDIDRTFSGAWTFAVGIRFGVSGNVLCTGGMIPAGWFLSSGDWQQLFARALNGRVNEG